MDLLLNHFPNGVIITDPDGHVVFINNPYCEFLNLDPKEQIGRHVTDVIENTRMHIVGRTGQAEINDTQVIRGKSIVVQRIPIFKDGAILAVFGLVMFRCSQDVQKLADELKFLESKVKIYEKELLSLRKTRYTIESISGRIIEAQCPRSLSFLIATPLRGNERALQRGNEEKNEALGRIRRDLPAKTVHISATMSGGGNYPTPFRNHRWQQPVRNGRPVAD